MIIKMLEEIKPRHRVLQIIWNLCEDWDTVVYVMRQFCCSISAYDKFTEYLYFFGEGGSGKDTLLLLIITLLGEVNPGYAKRQEKLRGVRGVWGE